MYTIVIYVELGGGCKAKMDLGRIMLGWFNLLYKCACGHGAGQDRG